MNFFDLPIDISIFILREWLTSIKSLLGLDVAAAKSVRSEYLGLLAHPTFLVSSPLSVQGKRTSCVDLYHWMNTRMVRFSSLLTTVCNIQHCMRISYARLASVSELTVRTSQAEELFDAELFRRFLTLLPSLTAVDLSALFPFDSAYLTVLALSGLPLKVVKLDDDIATGEPTIGMLIAAISTSAQVLVLGERREINGSTLSLISSRCTGIQQLHLTCKGISSQIFIAALGSDALPLLVDLTVRCRGHPLTSMNDEVAMAVFRHHPALTHFKACEGSTISFTTCSDAILLCPHLARLSTASYDLLCDDAAKVCTFSLFNAAGMQIPLLQELGKISASKYPINRLFTDKLALTAWAINDLLFSMGKHLDLFSCCLGNIPYNDLLMERMASLCSTLKALYLHNCNFMSDLNLQMIAYYCHSLTHLLFSQAAGPVLVTDFGMCYLLCKIGERLVELQLLRCSSLTDAILLPMLTCCTQLKTLAIVSCGITSAALSDKLIIPNRLPLLESLLLDGARHGELYAWVVPNNAVDRRWAKMLDVFM